MRHIPETMHSQGLSPTIASVRGTWMEYLLGLSYNRYGNDCIIEGMVIEALIN